LFIGFFFIKQSSGLEDKLAEATQLSPDLKIQAVSDIASNWSGFVINWALGLLIVVAGISLVYGVYKFIMSSVESRGGLVRNLITVGVIAGIVILGLVFATGAIPPINNIEKLGFEVTHAMSKNVGTVLYITYITFGMTIIGVLYGEISKIWK
jgi:hypothetical protein